jgi:hypothetical protein
VLFIAAIWLLNVRLISSGLLMSAFGRYLEDEESVGDEESADALNTARRLALTYEAIYGPSESYVEAESTRTWLWLIFALLLNMICIRIELLMFQDMLPSS